MILMDPRLRRLQGEIESVSRGMTDQQWSWHPPGKWSASEVLEHLYLTYTGTTKGFSRVMEAGEPTVTAPTWKQRVGKIVVLGFAHMPAGREAPKMARPRGLPTEKVVGEIASRIAEMDDMIRQCESKFGSGELLDHPVMGPLSGRQWRKFHLVHGLHHIQQVRSLKQRFETATR